MDKENKSPSQALMYKLKKLEKEKKEKNYKTSYEFIQSNIVSYFFGHLSCMHFNKNLQLVHVYLNYTI